MTQDYMIEQLVSLQKQEAEARATLHRIEGAQQAMKHLLEKAARDERDARKASKTEEIQAEAAALREGLRSNCGNHAVSEKIGADESWG